MTIQIFTEKPPNFAPKVEVAATYIEINDKLLLLKRHSNNPQGRTWGVPGGKRERKETIENAALRELFEETAIPKEKVSRIIFLGSFFVKKPDIDYIYHMFEIILSEFPTIHLSEEHLDYKWVTPKELKELSLILGSAELLQIYYQRRKLT